MHCFLAHSSTGARVVTEPVLALGTVMGWGLGLGRTLQVGSFPNWDIWAEWNGKYRDDVRRFIKGDPGKGRGRGRPAPGGLCVQVV